MWVALLNLENMYGTEESLKKVFERALQFCEPMPVYQQLADIYAKSEKIKVKPADSLFSCLTQHILPVHDQLLCPMSVSRRRRACIRRW